MASMSRSSLRAELIRLGRIGSNVSTTILDDWLYEAVKQVQNDTLWLTKRRNYYTREYFDVGTDEGFGIILATATGEVQLLGVSTAQNDVSGEALATGLENEWNTTKWGPTTGSRAADTGIAVDYSTATRKFSVTSQSASYTSTGIIVCSPLYANNTGTIAYDLTYKLFGITDGWASASTYTYTGNAAPYAYAEYPLPADFLYAKEVRYTNKSYPLRYQIYKDRDTGTGTPSHYYIYNDRLGLSPCPTSGGNLIEFDYYYLPADFAADASLHPFDEVFNFAIIWYAVSLYKRHQEDINGMILAEGKYQDEITKMSQRKNARGGGAIDMLERGVYRDTWDPRRFNF